MAAGRLTMGYVTDLFGLYRPMTVAICAALACQVLFFLVVTSSSSTAIIGILGFFIGPGYPSAMIALTIVLPANERVGTTSIVNSAGQAGAAILPFALGALSGRFGIEVFNYIVSGEILALLVLWRWLIKTSSKES
jgi:fucose permease